MNKKFTSAVLAGAMAISALSVSAFAADDTQQVKAAGETTLKASASFAPVAIDVTLPTSITAAINPYKIDYQFEGTAAGTSGVISPVYEIANNTADYGVKVGAKVWASLEKGSKVSIASVNKETKAAPVFKNDNTEDKQIFAYLNTTVEADKSFANTTYTADDETQVLFTEDEPDNAVVLMQIAKATGKGYFQIQGDCVEEPEEKWAATDKVDLNIVFDINPFNDSAEGGAGGSFTAAVAADKITVGGAGTLGDLVANNTYAVAYDGGVGGNVTPTFAGYSVTGATCDAASGCTVRGSDARFSCTADGTYDIVIELENDSDSSDTPTITFRVTASDC